MQDSASVGAQCADDLFLADRDPLNRIEVEELGDVAWKRFLHVQCHFGIDTLGWARRGAARHGSGFFAGGDRDGAGARRAGGARRPLRRV